MTTERWTKEDEATLREMIGRKNELFTQHKNRIVNMMNATTRPCDDIVGWMIDNARELTVALHPFLDQ